MLEEAARRELLRHDEGCAAVDWHQRAQELRRGPVERAEVVQAITRGDAEAGGGGRDVAEILAIVQYRALGTRAGAGGEQDHRVVSGPRACDRIARYKPCKRAVEGVILGIVKTTKSQARRGNTVQQII